jgi:hypothetical protein
MYSNEGKDESGKKSNTGLYFILGLIFLPALIVGGLIYQLLRRGRQRFSVIFTVVVILELALLAAWNISGALEKSKEVFTNLTEISANWSLLLPAAIIINMALGGLIGLFFSGWDIRQMKIHPHRLQINGNWMYRFKYRRTPIQILFRKKAIAGLKDGSYVAPNRAPIGLDEENGDRVVYRFAEEAAKQTLISGTVGSGKALHKETLIPSPTGLKTVESTLVGDTIFDELGNHTKVIGKYQPMTKDHFMLTFSDGTQVKACGDHLWNVTEIEKTTLNPLWIESTIETRNLFSRMITNERFAVKSLSNSVETPQRILPFNPRSLGLWLAGSNSSNWPVTSSINVANDLSKIDSILRGYSLLKIEELMTDYEKSSTDQRISLLSGFAEVSGVITNEGKIKITSENKVVIKSLRRIAASLAWRPTDMHLTTQHSQSNSIEVAPGEIVHGFDFTPETQLFRRGENFRKLSEILSKNKGLKAQSKFNHIVKIEEIDDNPEDYYCFEVDSKSHLFLCSESYIPTHNTITLLSLIAADIENGDPVIVIDFKRSPELASKCAAWAAEANANFLHFVNGDPGDYDVKHSPGQAFYDPLKNGSPTSKADMVLGMREYDTASAVYKAAMQQLLQVLFSMLHHADRSKAPKIDWDSGGIALVASAIDAGNLSDLASACEGTPIQADAQAIDEQSRGKTQIKHALTELQGQLRTITASDYGRWLKQDPTGENIDLLEATRNSGNVILFSINSDSEPDFARYVGSMILSDLTSTSAFRRNGRMLNNVRVYVDEFQAVPPTAVTSLLEKSRESRIAMTLAQQSFEQIISASERNGEAYLLSILDTCSNFIVHSGATEDTAERLAKILGKHTVTTYSQSNQNSSSFLSNNWTNKRNQTVQTKEEEKWKVNPSTFMSLSSPGKSNNYRATAVFITKAIEDPHYKKSEDGAKARVVWMIPNNKVIASYHIPKFVDGQSSEAPPLSRGLAELEPRPFIDSLDPHGMIDDEAEIDSHPIPNDYDLIAERATAKEINTSEDKFDHSSQGTSNKNQEEESDGGFGWETTDNEDQSNEDELRQFSEIDVQLPISVVKHEEDIEDAMLPSIGSFERPVKNPPSRNTERSSSFSSIIGTDFKPQSRIKDEKKLPDIKSTPKNNDISPKESKDYEIDDDSDETPLPNIIF